MVDRDVEILGEDHPHMATYVLPGSWSSDRTRRKGDPAELCSSIAQVSLIMYRTSVSEQMVFGFGSHANMAKRTPDLGDRTLR